jgi:hypothetical protein
MRLRSVLLLVATAIVLAIAAVALPRAQVLEAPAAVAALTGA